MTYEPQISALHHAALEPTAAPAKAARRPWREAASPQVTGTVDLVPLGLFAPQYLPAELEIPLPPSLASAPELALAPSLAPTPEFSPAPALASPRPQAPQLAQTPQRAPRIQPDEKAAYDTALALYNKMEYGKAREAFQAFLQSSPGSALAPNSLYWEGESLYALGLYDQAILVFQTVVNRFPKHDKAAAALLKTGYAYERLMDMDNARFFWGILLDDFPASAPAALARKRLGSG